LTTAFTLGRRTHRLEQVDQAEHVDVEGRRRLAVAAPHQRLGGEMEHHLGLEALQRVGHGAGRRAGRRALLHREAEQLQMVRTRLGGSARPQTSAPSACSQSASQEPLKPVWPVTSTRRPR
jgi:hypothetical protein